jgi:hypothetical protein
VNPDQQFWWNWGVNLSVAVFTLLAVLVALFGEKLRARFFPPILKLKLLRKEGEKAPLTRLNEQGVVQHVDDSRYYHLHVWNERRWSPAEQVQVFLTRLYEPGPSDDFQLAWAGNVPLRWRDQEFVPLLQTVGAAKDCDLCMVLKKGRTLSLMPLIVPNNLKARWQGKCKFVACVQVRSNQADSEVLRIQVSWDGEWEDGDTEMQRHLDMKELSSSVGPQHD